MVNRYPAMMFSLVESPTLEKFQGTDVLEPKIYLTRALSNRELSGRVAQRRQIRWQALVLFNMK